MQVPFSVFLTQLKDAENTGETVSFGEVSVIIAADGYINVMGAKDGRARRCKTYKQAYVEYLQIHLGVESEAPVVWS